MQKTQSGKLQGRAVITLLTLIALLFPLSMVASIYSDGVNSLLSARGLRWMVSHLMSNFSVIPWAEVLFALFGISVFIESGLPHSMRKGASLKQRRALQTTVAFSLIVLILFSLLLFLPDAVLLSSFGSLTNSPFTKGAYGLAVLFVMLVSNTFGYTSGKFASVNDFVNAHVAIFPHAGRLLVIMFLSAQFITCLRYTNLI